MTSIALEMGTDSSRCAILHWIGGGGDAVAPSNAQQMSCKPRQPLQIVDDMDWEEIQVIPVTRSVDIFQLFPILICYLLPIRENADYITSIV